MIFETHAHYEDAQFDADREELLASLRGSGVATVVNVASSVETVKKSIALADTHDFIYAAVGVHPSDISDLNEESFAWLCAQTEHQKVVAVGEIGLDYYWDKDETVQKSQRYWFERQLGLARKTGLPVIIHSRDAAADTLALMKKAHAQDISGVIHCFSYSVEQAEEYVRMGYYIGVGGVVTFKNAKKLKQVVSKLPLERLVLETDCPYMAPEPHRGERNSSRNLLYVAAQIAALKDIPVQEVIEVTEQNAQSLYRIPVSG